jgi:hypothetical protein
MNNFRIPLTFLVLCIVIISINAEAQRTQSSEPVIEFLGLDYRKLGYTISKGEDVSLLFRNISNESKVFPVSWTLKTYTGDSITSGETLLSIISQGVGKVPVNFPDDLKGGPYNIFFSPKIEGWGGIYPFYIDYRRQVSDEKLNIDVVSFTENMDAEGWMRMMLGPLEKFVNVRNEFPEDLTEVDAAVVIAEALDYYNPRFERLQSYVRKGGTIIVFGKTAPVLSMLLPVNGSETIPEKGKPVSLRPGFLGPWQDFNTAEDILHYHIPVSAKKDAIILASWSDGSPAIVAGDYGLGKVIYVSTGSFQVWQDNNSLKGADELLLRLLYDAKGGSDAVSSMLEYARETYRENEKEKFDIRERIFEGLSVTKPEEFVVISKNNIGRFGWLINEGGLAENILDDGRVTTLGTQDWRMTGAPPMRPETVFTFSFATGGKIRPRSTGVSQNWLAKTIEWSYENNEIVHSTISLGSPAILWEGNSRTTCIQNDNITHVAFPGKNGIVIYERGDRINPEDMNENWMLTFISSDTLRDMPQLIVFTKKPQAVDFNEDLKFTFGPEGFEAIFTSRLYGIKRLAPGTTLEWRTEIPEEAVNSAKLWSMKFLDFPVNCDAIGWIDGDKVNLIDKFQYKNFRTDWKTQAVTFAVLPPVFSLAKSAGAPVHLPEDLTDLNFATKYGPLKGVAGTTAQSAIDIPPLDHRAIVPLEQMRFEDVINRNVRGLGLNMDRHVDQIRSYGGLFDTDMEPYDVSNTVPYTQAPQIDLYKWWLVFNAILAKSVYNDTTRAEVDRHLNTRYYETLNFYSHKSLVMQKREPFTGEDYMVTFVWPTQTGYGFRHFNDVNEASGVNVYCYTNYARYYGDWSTIKANWNLARELHNFLTMTQDWAVMSSGALDYWYTAGLDMLNSEPYGSLTFSYAAANTGNKEDELEGIVFGTRSMVTTTARLWMTEYLASVTEEGDPWREFEAFAHFNEMGLQATRRAGGGVAWLDTSKGAMHELALGYKVWVPESMNKMQRKIGPTSSLCDLTLRMFLGWDRDSLLASVKSSRGFGTEPRGWQSAKDLYDIAVLDIGNIPVFLSDWAPAEYISGQYNEKNKEMYLSFQSHLGTPYSVKIYSHYRPHLIMLNDEKLVSGWSYNPENGWLNIDLEGTGVMNLQIGLGNPVAPLHPYFTNTKQSSEY